TLLLPAYVAMLLGFVTFNIGMQQIGRWSRNPRNDQVIDRSLEKLGDRYIVVHYPEIGGKRLDHLVIYPGGALVLTAKEIDGEIAVEGKRWRRKTRGIRRFLSFSGPQLGQPGSETDNAVASFETYLEKQQMEIDVNGVIVFLHPITELDVENPEYPVLHADELAAFIQTLDVDETFSRAERDQLIEKLSQGADVHAPVTSSSRRRPVRRKSAPKVLTEKAS
ncbi:MAG: nuclease-related domain-containing protein, partial [Thermomicrobiales bacterium]